MQWNNFLKKKKDIVFSIHRNSFFETKASYCTWDVHFSWPSLIVFTTFKKLVYLIQMDCCWLASWTEFAQLNELITPVVLPYRYCVQPGGARFTSKHEIWVIWFLMNNLIYWKIFLNKAKEVEGWYHLCSCQSTVTQSCLYILLLP